jgi:hypothetical protein
MQQVSAPKRENLAGATRASAVGIPSPWGLLLERLTQTGTLASASSYRLGKAKETKFNKASPFILNGLDTMSGTGRGPDRGSANPGNDETHIAAPARPSEAQRRYLARGLAEPGGKLPLFDAEGREVPRKTIEACIAHGWAELWFNNPTKPDWLVCRLTAEGYRALGHQPPENVGAARRR